LMNMFMFVSTPGPVKRHETLDIRGPMS
jgi:hypothetical protein